MAVIQTAYSVGDVVFHGTTMTETFAHPCPDCLGSRKWVAESPAGGKFEVECPRCGAGYQHNRALNLRYVKHVPHVNRLTIGRVGMDSFGEGHPTYMCLETGVGSGSVYKERDLFPTEEAARAAAATRASLANSDAEGWVAKQYSETVKFSDYQLKDAEIEAAHDARRRSQYRIDDLIEDLEGAENVEEVRRAIEAWREGTE